MCLVFRCPELSRIFLFAVEINEVFKKYTRHPVLAIIDVQPQDDMGIPTDAYVAVEEVKDVRSPALSVVLGTRFFVSLLLRGDGSFSIILYLSMSLIPRAMFVGGGPTDC